MMNLQCSIGIFYVCILEVFEFVYLGLLLLRTWELVNIIQCYIKEIVEITVSNLTYLLQLIVMNCLLLLLFLFRV